MNDSTTSTSQGLEPELDPFAAAEAEVESGSPWRYREPDAPNPLTIQATGWSTGHTKLGEAEFLNGIDRDGKRWSVLVGCAVLTRRLIEGLVEEWDNDRQRFVVVDTLGRVQPGEIASMKFVGDREGGTGFKYPDFRVSRKPAQKHAAPQAGGDDIPY